MSEITDDFTAFFKAVWGCGPFAWQCALAEQVVETGRWPDVIDLPTGSGKTSALDIAVYALARCPETHPRRVAFVVDRRTIVDQTTRRARALAEALQNALDGPDTPIARVARSLVELSGSGVPLDVGQLRGGLPGGRSGTDDWLRWPDQPAVVVSTIDQFGSRVLFRGYGVTAGMRPIHAGLTGLDCLVLLDEVHLSSALVETLHALRDAGSGRISRANQVVRMSATVDTSDDTFPADPTIITTDPVLAPRVTVRKECRLPAPIGTPRQPAEVAWPAAIRTLIAEVGLTQGVLGIVVNRVATAIAIDAELKRLGYTSVLVTGRMRAHERQKADINAAEWADPDRTSAEGLRIVVSTQCIEVGADYSFDALITEICPLSSLRQRLGRLDRRGLHAASGRPAQALIVATRTQEEDDAIYGPALGNTLAILQRQFGEGTFDGGPLSNDLTSLTGLAPDLDPPSTAAAVLMPAHLDLLMATNPEPPASPDVDAFLHGFREPNADVTVVWRFDLLGSDATGLCTRDAARAILSALPAQPAERIDVPVAAVRRWLKGRPPMAVSDVDSPGEEAELGQHARAAWMLDDEGKALMVGPVAAGADLDPNSLRPGAVLYVPCAWGGLREGAWDPTSSEPVTDVGDEAARAVGWVAFRPTDNNDEWRLPDTNPESDGSAARALLCQANALASESHRQARGVDIVRYGDRWAVVRAASRALDGRDATNSHTGVRVTLREHVDGVSLHAADIARRCGLPAEIASDFALAGALHDVGKIDPRFQLSLVDDEIALSMTDEPLAKSEDPGRGHRPSTNPRWTYPKGTRHEYLSVVLAESDPAALAEANDRDLVLHLVATHHGNARPWPSVVPDPYPRSVSMPWEGTELTASTRLSADFGARHAERMHRLTSRYGVHGLAWLEALFRLADHRRSEAEASMASASEGS